MPALVTCPKCSKHVTRSALAAHLHRELGYYAWRCGLCLVKFSTLADAKIHFRSVFSPHGDLEEDILETHDPDKLKLLTSIYLEALEENSHVDAYEQIVLDDESTAKRRRLEPARENAYLEEGKYVTQPQPSVDCAKLKEEESDSSEAVEAPSPAPSDNNSHSDANVSTPTLNRIVVSGQKLLDNVSYSCMLCNKTQKKGTFHHHALRSHMDVQPFLCTLCPYKAKDKRHVIRHQNTTHPGAPAVVTSLMGDLKEEIHRTIDKCFGSTTVLHHTYSVCRSCGHRVRRINSHVASEHLRRPTSACRRCDFRTQQWGLLEMRNHVRGVHGETLSSANYEDLTPALVDQMRAMREELFGKGFDVSGE